MKNILLSALFALFVTGLSAQDYVVTFQPASGNAAIDSIRATNLTTNKSVKINGNETLSLVKGYTAISPLQKSPESGNLYPNPVRSDATLSFLTKTKQEVKLRIYNASGQLINQINQMVDPGIQRFNLKFPNAGIYSVSIVKTEGVESLKAVYTGETNQSSRISYTGIEKTITSENGDIKSVETGKTLSFNLGEIIQYSVFSGKNNTIEMDSPTASKTCVVTFYECIDKDNNSYKVVKIGDQVWMGENLKTTHYSDSSEIAIVTDNSAWAALTTGAYCWYNNDEVTNKNMYGALYNWFSVVDSRNLCPSGWHVPTDAEWTTLTNFLGGEMVAGGKLKETGTTQWNAPNTEATNESGFTGQPGGDRSNDYYGAGVGGYWWSSVEFSMANAWYRFLYCCKGDVTRFMANKPSGFSVRCLRDIPAVPTVPDDANYDNNIVDTAATNDEVQMEFGTAGKDKIVQYGGTATTTQYAEGSEGNDWILQQGGDKTSSQHVQSGDGDDTVYQYAGSGNTTQLIVGGQGNQTFTQVGGNSNDTMEIQGGATIEQYGGAGNDTMTATGSTGNDTVKMCGGTGNDTMTYTLADRTDTVTVNGGDGTDALTVNKGSQNVTLKDANGNVLYTSGDGGTTLTASNTESITVNSADGNPLYKWPAK